MLGRKISFSVVLSLAIVSPALVRAQYQQPTSEELKMTSDPKAPGAAAVYLDVEEVADDPVHYQSFYARIKVLGEKGKELATVEVPYVKGYNKIHDIKARTIHADGTVIPLVGKPEDLLVVKNGDTQVGKMVFTLPSVEVGSILEYKYQLDYDDHHFSSPMWEIQRPYPVLKAHYQFRPFSTFQPKGASGAIPTSSYLIDSKGRRVNSLIWWAKLPDGVKVQTDAGGHYTVDVTDIPATPDEEWMPPIDSVLYRVLFYYKSASSAQDFWTGEAKDWSKDVDRFAEQSSAIHQAVNGLIAPTDSEMVKAQKLYTAVEALDNTDYSRRKSESEMKQLKLKEARHAEDTWKQKSGDSEDIAMLYLAMARAAGLKAYAMKVVSRSRGVFDVSYMDMDQLNDTVILLAIDGKGVMVDPGEKMAPFGTMNWRHSDAGGLRQSDTGPGYDKTPMQPYTANVTIRSGDITLDDHGGMTGNIRIVMTGQEALRWRQAALRSDETEVKKQFNEELAAIVPQGVEAHVDHFIGLGGDPDASLMAVVTTHGALGTATSKRLLLPGFFFEARGHAPFVGQEKRLEPVDMHYGDRVSDEFTYHLPAGMAVEGAPTDTSIPWTGHAVCITKTVSTPGRVVIARSLARAFTEAKPNDYEALRGFYQKVAAADQQELVLHDAAPAAKGN